MLAGRRGGVRGSGRGQRARGKASKELAHGNLHFENAATFVTLCGGLFAIAIGIASTFEHVLSNVLSLDRWTLRLFGCLPFAWLSVSLAGW